MTLLLMLLACGNQTIGSFSTAKRRAANLPFTETFYCGCPLVEGSFDPGPCGYRPRRHNVRAQRVEWEHVVPASRLGQMFVEYRDGDGRCVRDGRPYRGRTCTEKVNERYRRILADLYNLRPTIGELNADRRALAFGEVEGEPRVYGSCDFEVAKVVEPPVDRRGDIARTYLYMGLTYGLLLSDEERGRFLAWDAQDPVDAAECQWARGVAAVQHNINTVVDQRCRERRI